MSLPEIWLRGPIAGIPSLLQPVAHALMQAREELVVMMQDFPDELLWQQPAGTAAPGFHLQHLSGVIDRLFTYARGEALSKQQLQFLKEEATSPDSYCTTIQLVRQFEEQVAKALAELATVAEDSLTDFRGVGRAQLPATKLGLYVHAAEHTMRHLGQLLVTAKVLVANAGQGVL
jgi:hypothetical protein